MQNVNCAQHGTILARLIYDCLEEAIQSNSIWYPRRHIPIPAPLMASNITTKHLKKSPFYILNSVIVCRKCSMLIWESQQSEREKLGL